MVTEKDEWLREKVIALYEYLYAATTNQLGLRFHPNEKQEKMVENFIKLLKKKKVYHSVGRDYLIKYFQFQFNYWFELRTRFDGKVMLGWVIGPKAWARWAERKAEFDFTIDSHILINKRRIVKSELFEIFEERENDFSGLSPEEEEEKKRFLNTFQGLAWCTQETTLFNHRSRHCVKCKSRNDCKKLLKAMYHKVYIARGYE